MNFTKNCFGNTKVSIREGQTCMIADLLCSGFSSFVDLNNASKVMDVEGVVPASSKSVEEKVVLTKRRISNIKFKMLNKFDPKCKAYPPIFSIINFKETLTKELCYT